MYANERERIWEDVLHEVQRFNCVDSDSEIVLRVDA